MTTVTRIEDPDRLAGRWAELRTGPKPPRIRDAADTLGVSELELLATTVGAGAIRLTGDPATIVHRLPELGRAMALTRGPHAVSEVRGRYGGIEITGRMGQVVGEHVDLRLFLTSWAHVIAVDDDDGSGGRRRSIQFFDARGTAVHKVYAEDPERPAAWDAIVRDHVAPVQDRAIPVDISAPVQRAEPDDDVTAALRAGWDAMQDTHEFFPLLRTLGLSRRAAFERAGDSRARRVADAALGQLLERAAAGSTRIMIFVGNHGCLQVFSGEVHRILRTGPWINVMDPGFNLHLREDRIASTWVVAKPTRSGVVTSLELLDGAGEAIAMVFRKRADRDNPEDPAWSQLLAEVG